MDKLIQCTGLTKQFGAVKALNNVSFSLDSGRIVGLLGPNGSGKTTLIKLLNGLIQPNAGEIRIDGAKPGSHTRSVISYLPDRVYFPEWMKTKDLLDFFTDFYSDFDRACAEAMLRELGIAEKQRIKAMSKGTKEKLQLAMVMSRHAKLYLLDEPIAGVDPAARDYILSTILRNYNRSGTVLISTHLIADVEPVLDEVILLKQGQIVRQGLTSEIREETGTSIDAYFRSVFRTVSAAPNGCRRYNFDPQTGKPLNRAAEEMLAQRAAVSAAEGVRAGQQAPGGQTFRYAMEALSSPTDSGVSDSEGGVHHAG